MICKVCFCSIDHNDRVEGVRCEIHQKCFKIRCKKFEIWYQEEMAREKMLRRYDVTEDL